MHAGGLGAAQERADVVRVLERVEDEDERRLVRSAARAKTSSMLANRRGSTTSATP